VANSTRENLIQAGLDLFHRHGIHLVGLDRILQKAGVTKTTFYNHFESKENFACAVIDRFGEELNSRILRRCDCPHTDEIKHRLLEIFDVWDELSLGKTFRGCLLVGAGVATGDRNDPARQAAIRNKRTLLKTYQQLAESAGIKNPERFAVRFGLLVDGALIARHLYDDHVEADEARKMAEQLINEETPKTRKPHISG
jgi:AcrR family transcriptional regulator